MGSSSSVRYTIARIGSGAAARMLAFTEKRQRSYSDDASGSGGKTMRSR